jgi:putative copper export protein
MIIELIQGEGDLFNILTVILRAIYSFASLAAAGLVLTLAVLAGQLTPEESRAARRWLLAFVLIGMVASLAAWPVRAIVLAKGIDGLWRWDFYPLVARSRIGDAFFLRMSGLTLALFGLWRSGAGVALAAIGAAMIAASYVAMGHSTLYRPRQELAALIGLHLFALSFWIGGLFALGPITQRRDQRSAAQAITIWSRAAMIAVAVMIATGIAASWYLVGSWKNLFASWHGWALIAKVSVVALMILIAINNKLRHTRQMAAGDALAGRALDRSIGREIVLAIIVVYLASEMVSVHPIDYGHRVSG